MSHGFRGGIVMFPRLDSTLSAAAFFPAIHTRPIDITATTANYEDTTIRSKPIWGRCLDVPQMEALTFNRSFSLHAIPMIQIHNYFAGGRWSYALFDDTRFDGLIHKSKAVEPGRVLKVV